MGSRSPVSARMAASVRTAALTLLLLLFTPVGSLQCPENHCQPHVTCIKQTDGSMKCDCDAGYKRNETASLVLSCSDIDECAEDSILCRHGTCVNKDGGYECDCDSGYYKSNDGMFCLGPYPVSEVQQVVRTHNITLRWPQPPQPKQTISWYSLNWSTQDGQRGTQRVLAPRPMIEPSRAVTWRVRVGPHARATIVGLQPGCGYTINVTAHFDNHTMGRHLFEIESRTRPLIQSEMTVVESDDHDDDTSIKVIYTPTSTSASQFDEYRFRVDGAGSATYTQSRPAAAPAQAVQFAGLVPGRLYVVTMWTVSHNVTSESVWLEKWLKPRPITQLNFTEIGSHEVTLSWNRPEGDFTFFRLVYCSTYSDPLMKYTSALGITVSSLRPYTSYVFTVTVFSGPLAPLSMQTSSRGSWATVRTREAPPPAPHKFSVLAVQPHALNFSWQMDPVKGVLRRFLLEYARTNETKSIAAFEFPPHARVGEVTGLATGEYWFSLRAQTGAGAGPAARLLRRIDCVEPRELRHSATTVTVSFRSDYLSSVAHTLVLAEQPRNDTPAHLPSWHDVHALDTWPAYQVTELYYQYNSSSVEEFTIGSEQCDVGNRGYCNGPLKPGTKYYVKLRVFTAPGHFSDTAYSVIYTGNTNYVVIISSTISAMALILLVTIAIKKRCWIEYDVACKPQLPKGEERNPFYLNLLFRKDCAKEIAEIEPTEHDEVEDYKCKEIEENDYEEID